MKKATSTMEISMDFLDLETGTGVVVYRDKEPSSIIAPPPGNGVEWVGSLVDSDKERTPFITKKEWEKLISHADGFPHLNKLRENDQGEFQNMLTEIGILLMLLEYMEGINPHDKETVNKMVLRVMGSDFWLVLNRVHTLIFGRDYDVNGTSNTTVIKRG